MLLILLFFCIFIANNMTVIEIINQIKLEKTANQIYPDHSLFYEVIKIGMENNMSKSQIRAELNNLYFEHKIKVGRTINDKYIKLI